MSERSRRDAENGQGDAPGEAASASPGLRGRLIERYGRAGAQRILERQRAGRARALETPAPHEHAPLTHDALVLTRDPGPDPEKCLDDYRVQISGVINSWGLTFDPETVSLAPAPATDGHETHVI